MSGTLGPVMWVSVVTSSCKATVNQDNFDQDAFVTKLAQRLDVITNIAS